MGNICYFNKKHNINKINNFDKYRENDIVGFNVCSIDLRLNDSFVKDFNDNNEIFTDMFNFALNDKYDIICMQGFNNKKLYDEFRRKLYEHTMFKNVELFFHPQINVVQKPDIFLNSLSEMQTIDLLNSDDKKSNSISLENSISRNSSEKYNSLIISKHKIISTAFQYIPAHVCTSNSIWDIVNINFNNTIISIFNATFQTDYIGVSNHRIRKEQIKHLRKSVIVNQVHIKNELEINQKNYSIICVQSNIQNFKNNGTNIEYEMLLKFLKSIDTYDYVQKIKYGIISQKNNDINNIRTNYIFLSQIGSDIYEKKDDNYSNRSTGIAIKNSILDKKISLLSINPFVTEFLIKKQTKEPFDTSNIIEITSEIQ
jgi:hypothetical protein